MEIDSKFNPLYDFFDNLTKNVNKQQSENNKECQ